MRTTIILASAALVFVATFADAQVARRSPAGALPPSARELFVRGWPAWSARSDNTRASYARQVNANGQGTN